MTKQAQIQELNSKLTEVTAQRDTALKIANFLADKIFFIESSIEQSSFKGNPKRPLFFLVKNYKEVITLIGLVIDTYKEVRNSLKPFSVKNENTGSAELPTG